MHRLNLVLYSHPKEFWGNGVRTHVNSKGKIPSTGKVVLSGGSYPRRCIKQDSEPNTLPVSYSGPQLARLICNFYIRVTARAVVCTDPSPRDTGHVAVTFKNPDTIKHTIRSASCLIHPCLVLSSNLDRLVGLVVRRPPRERKIPGSNPACAGIFSGSSHASDLNIGTPVAALPGTWRYRVSAGTGRPGVSIL